MTDDSRVAAALDRVADALQPENGDLSAAETKAWEVYGKLLETEIERQDAIKDSLEKRGNLIITTAGGFVTFLFGITGVVVGVQSFVPQDVTRRLIVVSMGIFVLAALLGLLANWTMKYRVFTPSALKAIVENDDYMNGATWVATKRVAQGRADHMKRAITKNHVKAQFVMWGFLAEVIAALVLVVALGIEVWPG